MKKELPIDAPVGTLLLLYWTRHDETQGPPLELISIFSS
jgi:hypothetical protein